MDSELIYDDPVWEYVIASKLQPYIPAVRKWWSEYDKLPIRGTGVFNIEYDDIDCPPGLMYRVTSTPVRSPIKNVQAFPFVAAAYLQITGVPGGVNKMIERECKKVLKLEEFTVVEKHNLPSTYHKGQLLALVPTSIMEGVEQLGKYMYLTRNELEAMAKGILLPSVPAKCAQYL